MASRISWLKCHRTEIDSNFGGSVRLFMKNYEEKILAKRREKYVNMPPVKKKKLLAEQRNKYANMTPAEKKKCVARNKQWRTNMTPAQKRKKLVSNRKWNIIHKDKVIEFSTGVKIPGGYQKQFDDQHGKCKFCRNEEAVINRNSGKIQALQTDHISGTKTFRGLLCQNCNMIIVGQIEHGIMVLPEDEILYILRYIGIKTILKIFDKTCGSNLLELYKAKNKLHPWKRDFPDRKFRWNSRFKHGVGVSDYNILMDDQDGLCALCHKKETRRHGKQIDALSGDHSHRTNKVRGLLCTKCNNKVRNLDNILDLYDFSKHWFTKVMKYIGTERIINKLTDTIA